LRNVFSREADPFPSLRSKTSVFNAFPTGVLADCSARSFQDGSVVTVADDMARIAALFRKRELVER